MLPFAQFKAGDFKDLSDLEISEQVSKYKTMFDRGVFHPAITWMHRAMTAELAWRKIEREAF